MLTNSIVKPCLLILALLALLSLNTCSDRDDERKQPPFLENGIIDLRHWDFHEDGPVDLVGNWKFYWKRFLTSKDLQSDNPGFILAASPGVWNRIVLKDKEIGAQGFATYRATVLAGKDLPGLALKIQFVYSAYDVYINDTLIGKVGTAATSADQAEEINRPTMMNITVDQEKFDIILHVSNFHFMYGGIPTKISLGEKEDIRAQREFNIAFEMLIAGIILFMGIYHLVLYLLRKKEVSYLYFAIHCFGVFAYGTITGECFLLQQDYLNSFDAALRITVISSALSILFISLFTEAIYGRMVPKSFLWCQAGLFSLFIISGSLVPTAWIPFVHTANQILILVSYLHSWMTIIAAALKKKKGARIMLGGVTFFLLTAINDIAVYHALIDNAYYASLGLFILCLTEAIVLSLRMTAAFFAVESLSESLDKSNKRLQKLDELKNDFLARTSHELKTPLSGIIGTTEIVLEKSGHLLPEDDLSSLSAVISNGSRLTYLINDILDYSKLQKEEVAIYRTAVDVAACSRLVTDLLKPLFDRKQVSLISHLREGLPLVYADDSRIQQIFHNLLSNSVKFTPEGGNVELKAREQGRFLSVMVTDTGCGIPENERENVFIPFEQIESPDSSKKSGTGLGLSITKNLVELHGGTIAISGNVSGGTNVAFTLPVFRQVTNDNANSNGLSPIPQLPHPPQAVCLQTNDLFTASPHVAVHNHLSATILVVDDEPVNLMVLSSQLAIAGYNIITASSSAEALEMIEEKEIDLVLLDYMMPDLNGYEVLKRIREVERTPTSFPVIMITAFFHSNTAAKCFEQGANDYLYKPVKKEDLLMRVKNQLEIKEKVELGERLKTYKKIEVELQQLRKMEQVVNLLDEKVIIAQPDQVVAYSNQSADTLIGYRSQELRGKNLDIFICKDSLSRLWERKSDLDELPGMENAILEPRVTILQKNGDKIRTSVSMSHFKSDRGKEYIIILKAEQGAGAAPKFREQAVKAMNNCVWLWETYTGKTKTQLAKESGIWTVSFDTQKGMEKAQTLEKYLKAKTFPSKRPKINAIAGTVHFILNQEAIPNDKKEELELLLNELSATRLNLD